MFKDLVSNEKAKKFLQNELRFGREAGTYLFYGSDRDLLKKFAKAFAKGLNCSTYEDDFCGVCENCIRIESETHGDLEIIEESNGIKIDQIRGLGYKDSINSYEGKRKIYIIRDIEKMRKESGNALLKLIEEPNKGSFFILLSNSLNILPTIKSRSILLNIQIETPEELGVSKFEYEFFQGNSRDIEEYKRLGYIDLKEIVSYQEIGKKIKSWISTQSFEDKVEVYKAIRDFINTKEYLTVIDKIYFVEEIMQSASDRELLKKIVNYTISTVGKNSKNLEKLLELKKILRSPINMKNFLLTFFTEL
ncbi:ATPase [Cetobacterium sp. 8H]|uniref:ATPase n=1 Tax=Cetobacterium sp. 8H TaxID=2759681 RepID=UPI00163CF56B|nr:ATPase [Cetobacterium sp. 8H]MBC2850753.1 ATPase [Cetobacterium sp. 8H]